MFSSFHPDTFFHDNKNICLLLKDNIEGFTLLKKKIQHEEEINYREIGEGRGSKRTNNVTKHVSTC